MLHRKEREHLRFTREPVLFVELLEVAHELHLIVDDIYDAVLVHPRLDPTVLVRLMQTI
jgi:hypothetical protein